MARFGVSGTGRDAGHGPPIALNFNVRNQFHSANRRMADMLEIQDILYSVGGLGSNVINRLEARDAVRLRTYEATTDRAMRKFGSVMDPYARSFEHSNAGTRRGPTTSSD
jgi:hypothetical protein